MQHLIFVIIGLPTVPAILRNSAPGSRRTLNLFPRSERFCVVLSRYRSLTDTSAIRTHEYSPSSSKYFGSSIGLGDAPRLTTVSCLIPITSQCAGTCPNHSTLESFISIFRSRPLVTAWLMRAVRFSASFSSRVRFLAMRASICAVLWSRKQAMVCCSGNPGKAVTKF